MEPLHDLPYSPALSNLRGVVRVHVGDTFVVDAGPLGELFTKHQRALREGSHPCLPLQVAWDKDCMEPVRQGLRLWLVLEVKGGSDWKGRLAGAEAEELGRAQREDDGCADLRILSKKQIKCSVGDTPAPGAGRGSAALKQRWKNPAYRDRVVGGLRGREVREDTRARHRAAKCGGLNPRARRCWIRLDDGGSRHHFPTVSAAAMWLGVPQQVLDLWLRGVVPWPGGGRRSRKYARLEGVFGGFGE